MQKTLSLAGIASESKGGAAGAESDAQYFQRKHEKIPAPNTTKTPLVPPSQATKGQQNWLAELAERAAQGDEQALEELLSSFKLSTTVAAE